MSRRTAAVLALAAGVIAGAGLVPLTSAAVVDADDNPRNRIGAATNLTPIPAECDDLDPKHAEIIVGTDGDDTLSGRNGKPDFIFGLGGDDTLRGDSGKDCLVGGSGDDTLVGEQGKDVLIGGSGNDLLTAEPEQSDGNGHDRLYGGPGDDTLEGGNGPDLLHGGPGQDSCSGGHAPDWVECETTLRTASIAGLTAAEEETATSAATGPSGGETEHPDEGGSQPADEPVTDGSGHSGDQTTPPDGPVPTETSNTVTTARGGTSDER